MKNPFALVYNFFLAFFLLLLVSVSSDVIQESCDKAAKGDDNIKFDFCVAALEANPKSENATTVEDLASISIDIAMSNATNIMSKISELLKNKKLENYTRMCLEDCSELYSDVPSDLRGGKRALESKDYGTASLEIGAAMDDSDTCEEGFEEKKGLVSPLKKENNDFFQLTAICLAFIAMLQ